MTLTNDDLPHPPELFPGDEVGDYVVDELLSEESSDVYRAHHAQDGRPVALKIVTRAAVRNLPDFASTRGIPHLVETYEVGTCDRRRVGFVAMRFVVGRKLGCVLDEMVAARRRPDAHQQRLLVARCVEVASALAELHRRGHVHRDVKPQNILVEGADDEPLAGSAVLVDLGIAHLAGAPGAASTLVYTLPYAAPEQHLGHEVDGRTDVFGLGVTLHDLLLGRSHAERPVRQTRGLEPLTAVAPDIDGNLAAIVAECVEPQPERRYASAAVLVADLRRWLAGRAVSVRPRSPLARYRRMLRREQRRALRITLIIVAIAIGLFGAGAWMQRAVDRALLAAEASEAIADGDLALATSLVRRADDSASWLTDAAGPLTPVVELVLAEDPTTARRLAARLVSRDGLQAHPALDRWFARLLRDGDAAVRRDACSLLARALYDQPAHAPIAAGDALFALATTDRGETSLYALTALGGIADSVLGARLLDSVRPLLVGHEYPREYVRLLINVLHRVTARIEPQAAPIQAAEANLRACLEVAMSYGDFLAWHDLLRAGVDAWFLSLRRLRDGAGLPPPNASILPPGLQVTPVSRGVTRDPTLLDEVLSGKWPWSGCDSAHDRGLAIGIRGISPAERRGLRDALLANPTATGTADCLADFDRGLDHGERVLRHSEVDWRPDPGARCADEIEPDTAAYVPVQHAAIAEPGVLAAWDLRVQPGATTGIATRVAGRHARVMLDEDDPPVPFGWLGTPGQSQFAFSFVAPTEVARNRRIVVEGQKGLRGAFPWGGIAGLDVLFESEVVATWRDPGTTERQRFVVPLPPIEPGRAREIIVRLAAASNTTFRLYRVAIE